MHCSLGIGDGRSLGHTSIVVELSVHERIDRIGGMAVVVGQLDADTMIDLLVIVEHVLSSHKAAAEADLRVELELGLFGHEDRLGSEVNSGCNDAN